MAAEQAKSGALVLLRSPWETSLRALIASARNHVLVCSPFFDRHSLALVGDELVATGNTSGERVGLLTDLSPHRVAFGAVDVTALSEFVARTTIGVRHLPGLHAKVYVADSHTAIVTSGNLTSAGIGRNYEYGLLVRDEGAVRTIRDDIEVYGRLGVPLDLTALTDMAARAARLTALRRRLDSSMRAAVRREFERALEDTTQVLLERRVHGQTTNQLFAGAILYALRGGPLTTEEIHPRVQAVYPDLCDDSVDRIIDGRHFGRKWKHLVRDAQQYLKRRGAIVLEGGKWRAAIG